MTNTDTRPASITHTLPREVEPEVDVDALDRLARLAMTAAERVGYENACRWAVPPVGGPYHFLVQSAAMSRPDGFRVWPSLDDYAAAGREVRARITS